MDVSSVRRGDVLHRSVDNVLDVDQAIEWPARSRDMVALLMNTRKVTATGEKVLALAVEWAEAEAREEAYYAKHGGGIYAEALWPLTDSIYSDTDRADKRLRSAIRRLLKRRRAKVKK